MDDRREQKLSNEKREVQYEQRNFVDMIKNMRDWDVIPADSDNKKNIEDDKVCDNYQPSY